MEISIKKTGFGVDDFMHVAEIHQQELSQGFLSSLGPKALMLMFSYAAQSNSTVFYTAKTADNSTVGFLLATSDINEFYKGFLRTKFFVAFITLLPKVLSLSKIRKIFETLLYPSKQKGLQLPKAELLDIAIRNDFQGKGIARKLFNEMCTDFQSNNIDSFKITTGKSLEGAQSFYEKIGAQKVGETEVHRGETTIIYVYDNQ